MISVLTLTYQRHHLLEEAIQSFLLQNREDCEMVIINDSNLVEYQFEHPNIRIFNLKDRFSSIGDKLRWGYEQCKYNFIYRLDDDDLLYENALVNSIKSIEANPGRDVYRSESHYLFENNEYRCISGSVNNGNIYTRDYLDRIDIPLRSGDEDVDMTFGNDSDIYASGDITMIYRWGMNTYHISGMGINTNDVILSTTDLLNKESGCITLSPHFEKDYWSCIK